MDPNNLREPVGLLDFLEEGLTVWDHEGRCTYENARARELVGESMLGEELADCFDEPLVEVARTILSGDFERVSRPYGGKFKMNLARFGEGLVVSFQPLGGLERAKHHFIANIGHEIRTPLNGIIGVANLLGESSLDERQREYVDMLKESGYTLMAIINDILDFSRLEAGKMHLVVEPIYLRECIESAFDVVNDGRGLALSYYISPQVPSHLKCDRQRLRQVLVNLLGNAVKFTEAVGGRVSLNVDLVSANPPSSPPVSSSGSGEFETSMDEMWSSEVSRGEEEVELIFRVVDNGIGISEEELPKIFESFERSDGHRPGTGLGLAICKKLVELMGGAIYVDSILGEGSTFSFTIKCEAVETPTDINLEGMRVLIASTDEATRLMLATTILKWGGRPTPCAGREEALLLIPDCQVALVDNEFRIKGERVISLVGLGEEAEGASLTRPVKEGALLRALRRGGAKVVRREREKRGERVLVVEDAYINLKVLEGYLRELGFHRIDLAENGEEALRALRAEEYALMLLDIKMPVMNGEELLERARRDGLELPYTIVVTAYVGEEASDHYINDCGADDYLSKPVTLEQLKGAIASFYQTCGQMSSEGGASA